MSEDGHRKMDDILDDLDAITARIANGEDLGAEQEKLIREMNNHPETWY